MGGECWVLMICGDGVLDVKCWVMGGECWVLMICGDGVLDVKCWVLMMCEDWVLAVIITIILRLNNNLEVVNLWSNTLFDVIPIRVNQL